MQIVYGHMEQRMHSLLKGFDVVQNMHHVFFSASVHVGLFTQICNMRIIMYTLLLDFLAS